MKQPLEEPEPSFTIKPVETSFKHWIESPYIKEETRKRLLLADVLLVPDEGHAGDGVRYFPHATIDFYDFLNRNKPTDMTFDACIEDEDYKELSLHADLLIIAGLIVVNFAAPIVVNLISDYISERLGNRKKAATVKSKLIITFEEDRRSVEFDYYGPAENYSELMLDALSKVNSLPNEPQQIYLEANLANPSVQIDKDNVHKRKNKNKKQKKRKR